MNVGRLEAKNAIRLLCYKWHARSANPGAAPDIRLFIDWMDASGYAHYLKFESETSPSHEVRAWFAEEFQQAS